MTDRILLHKSPKYSIIGTGFWKGDKFAQQKAEGTYYMALRIAITDDLNSEREKLSSAIVAPFEKVGLEISNIDEYTSGEGLLKQFSAGKYDLIFLDIYMGGMSGVETAKRIRAIDKNVMLVFVTTSTESKFLSVETHTSRQRKTACRNACTADAEYEERCGAPGRNGDTAVIACLYLVFRTLCECISCRKRAAEDPHNS